MITPPLDQAVWSFGFLYLVATGGFSLQAAPRQGTSTVLDSQQSQWAIFVEGLPYVVVKLKNYAPNLQKFTSEQSVKK